MVVLNDSRCFLPSMYVKQSKNRLLKLACRSVPALPQRNENVDYFFWTFGEKTDFHKFADFVMASQTPLAQPPRPPLCHVGLSIRNLLGRAKSLTAFIGITFTRTIFQLIQSLLSSKHTAKITSFDGILHTTIRRSWSIVSRFQKLKY